MAGKGKWRPKREASTDGSTDDPRRDVADYRAPATTRQQRELGNWARETSAALGDAAPTPAQEAARARSLREDYGERAAIFEYLGGFPRGRAEQMARELVYGPGRQR